ncbi:putative phosphoserine aminotransferase [Armadillidium nasatum]|uniref:Phosphoserine aminotransferase n=1 Tax=Armadillidium nasatum TaxID=96803 RepID=A0A5N5SZ99_9CRUS|nr:putative phosphoserine aminotransferase [Armadillidium nasatum]
MSKNQNIKSYFGAGPSKIPNEVLKEVQDEMLNFDSTDVSILEVSHRSKNFENVVNSTVNLVKDLMKVPDNYKVILLQGGGNGQFAGVPLNLLNTTGKADYIVTGAWSEKAFKEGKKYGAVNSVFQTSKTYTGIPPQDNWVLDPEASYLYYCDNETIDGVEFDFIPKTRDNVPLVCDMSSNILSRVFDVSKFGVVFAGAQKNIGCAGITLVLVRDDLIGKRVFSFEDFKYGVRSCVHLTYDVVHPSKSTRIYVLNKVLKWVKENGGVENMEKMAIEKSSMIYKVIDDSKGFYYSHIKKNSRSRMNITFRVGGPTGDEALEKKFLEEAAAEGLLALKGHRSVGGVRASLYNAVTVNDAIRLRDFMKNFMNKQ